MRVCRGVPGEPCNRIIPAVDYYCPGCKTRDNQRRALKAQRNGLRSPYWKAVREARLRLDGIAVSSNWTGALSVQRQSTCRPNAKGIIVWPRLRTLDQRVATATA
jgi:hypothetical protein